MVLEAPQCSLHILKASSNWSSCGPIQSSCPHDFANTWWRWALEERPVRCEETILSAGRPSQCFSAQRPQEGSELLLLKVPPKLMAMQEDAMELLVEVPEAAEMRSRCTAPPFTAIEHPNASQRQGLENSTDVL